MTWLRTLFHRLLGLEASLPHAERLAICRAVKPAGAKTLTEERTR